MKDKWLEELREGMSDFEMDAPEGLWESLGVEKTVPKSQWRRRWIASAAAIAILIIGAGIILWLSKTESLDINDIKYAETKENVSPGQSESGQAATNKTATISNENLRLTESQKGGKLRNKSATIKATTDYYVSNEESTFSLTDTVKTEDLNPHDQSILSDKTTKSERQHLSEDKESFYTSLATPDRKSHNAERLAIKMSASGIGNAAEGTLYRIPGQNGNDYFLSGSDPEPWFGASGLETITIRHHQPVKLGLTMQYNISERIGIESGLVYSRIGSDISVSRDNMTSMGIRKLQYVGIPLNVKLYALTWKFIDLYLSAGITGEKCVSNRFEKKSLSDGLSLEAFSKQKEKPFQWSANAAAGIQLKATPNIGIFAEPGVSYYFNDGTSLETIYKDRPCSFNLNVGLRFNINPK